MASVDALCRREAIEAAYPELEGIAFEDTVDVGLRLTQGWLTVRLLYDAVLPQSLSHEAPAGVELVRWDGADVPDADLVKAAAERGCRGVVLLGWDSLEQSDLRDIGREVGVALVATATHNSH